MNNFHSRWLNYTPADEQTPETPKHVSDKTDKSREPIPDTTPVPAPSAEGVPRLPWQLERLVSAAHSDQLPKEPVMLSSGLVPDLNRYTLGWAAAYLTGDRQEALSRLWQVRRVWQGETSS